MKTTFFLLFAFTIGFAGLAQSKGTIKLYGFGQNVSRGKAPEMNPETGLRTSAGAGKNYYLYAVSSSRIYPTEIWIEGTKFGVTIRFVETPVKYSDAGDVNAPAKLLVPKTSQRVIQLAPSAVVKGKSVGTKAKSLASSNDVVLVYKQNGKFYYNTLKALSNLADAAAL